VDKASLFKDLDKEVKEVLTFIVSATNELLEEEHSGSCEVTRESLGLTTLALPLGLRFGESHKFRCLVTQALRSELTDKASTYQVFMSNLFDLLEILCGYFSNPDEWVTMSTYYPLADVVEALIAFDSDTSPDGRLSDHITYDDFMTSMLSLTSPLEGEDDTSSHSLMEGVMENGRLGPDFE
jgi:hypothetical protein